MFVEFLSTDLADLNICVTSAIRSIDVSTDAPAVTISLAVQDAVFYSATLYAYNGKVSLDDVGHLIESWFRTKSLYRASVTVKAVCSSDSSVFDTMTIDCLHCSHVVPDSFEADKIFFSCLRTHRVSPTAKFKLYGPLSADDPVLVNVSGTDADGVPVSGSLSLLAAAGYIDVNIPTWTSYVCSHTSIASPAIMSIRCKGMEKSIFIDRNPEYMEFSFRNCFNVPEPVFLPGKSVMKPEVSVDTAVCSGRTIQYNRVLSRSYEFTSGPLTRYEAAAMVQLLESYSAAVVVDGSPYEIVITDNSTEVSSEGSSLNVLKFTWQFADRRPHLFGDDLDPLLYSSQIFTEQFQEQYM